MGEYKIVIEKAAVGHVAKAITENGEIVAVASGFGEKDAKRQLKAKILGAKPIAVINTTKKRKPKRNRKIHTPSGVIFAAKNNIERYKAKRAGKRGVRR